jgi:hypothetical protein
MAIPMQICQTLLLVDENGLQLIENGLVRATVMFQLNEGMTGGEFPQFKRWLNLIPHKSLGIILEDQRNTKTMGTAPEHPLGEPLFHICRRELPKLCNFLH